MAILRGVFHVAVVVGLFSIFYYSYEFGYGAFSNEPLGTNDGYRPTVVVQEGDTQKEVAEQLYSMDMISCPEQFLFRARFSEYNGKIKPGTYEVSASMGIDDILKRLTQTETAN